MKTLTTLLLLFISVSCYQSGSNEAQTYRLLDLNSMKTVKFKLVKDEILTPYCVQCHGWCKDEAKFQRKLKAGKPDQSRVYKKVVDGSMPIGYPPLNTAQLEILERYIKDLKGTIATGGSGEDEDEDDFR